MSDKDTFFITTPIYYTNGIPHIGHSYSTIIADSIARYQKISGKRVKFSTGVDENSQKITDSKICRTCKTRNNEHANFCFNCGEQHFTDVDHTQEKK